MDNREETVLTAEERKRRRIERRKRELRIARIKFGVGCGIILLLIILLVVACTKGCKKDEPVETTPVSTEAQTEAPTEPPKPTFAYNASDWKLLLVDDEHPLAQDYSVDLTTLRSGAKISSQCMEDLQAMFDACREAGFKPTAIGGYLSETDVQKAYDTRVSELMSTGFTQELAEKEALKTVSKPGASEYQTGLALDIAAEGNTDKDADALEDCAELNWMRENSWQYGFVERYTEAQAARMGKTYQPWRYRYVGKEAAKDMRDMDLCLEELVSMLE